MAQQQHTTPFYPVFVCRSDGTLNSKQPGGNVQNSPDAKQLDRTPDARGQCDYYRLIECDEPKHLDWRKKLGGMLLREVGGKPYENKWQQAILHKFPENYRLYEHIKSKADGKVKTVKKNHSGGGHDRQDAYLYGYPEGPRKRFRSPADFFPHLLWLETDEAGDSENCTCKLCSPVQFEPEKEKERPQTQTSHVTTKSPHVLLRQVGGTGSAPASPAVHSPAPNTGRPRQALPPPPSGPVPTPLPQPRSIDQQVDAQYGKLLARLGEVTWFQRETLAWGLGVILRRWISKDGSDSRAYVVQPLSHPTDMQRPLLITDGAKLRPWLAWSAPPVSYKFLLERPHLTYRDVDWQALLSGRYGEGNPEVDGSILATKFVDTTYTPFELLKTTTTNTGQQERHWNGLYLGAEKIWNGDPVRIQPASGDDIMVVTDIVERPASISNQSPVVQCIGDVYRYDTLPAPNPNSPPEPPPNPYLPIRLREDMHWRNLMLVPEAKELGYWRLVASQSCVDIANIKGRWYETSLVFAQAFRDSIQEKRGGVGNWINSRSDSTGIRVDNRLAALGLAVPKGTVLVDGLEPPNHANPPPNQEMQTMELGGAAREGGAEVGGVVTGAETGFALDDYMNLGDEGLTFGDQFHFS